MAAGAIFGLVRGTITVSLASTTGAALALLIARYLARDRVAKMFEQNPKFEAIDKAVGERGWKIVAMLRLSPAVPFNLQNYLYGLTSIRFWPCVLTSWVAMLPGTFMYVYLGTISREGLEAAAGVRGGKSPGEWALLITGLVATVVVTVYVTRLATRAIKQRTQIDQAGKESKLSSQAERQADLKPKGWPWGATITALVAITLVTLAAFAQ